MRINIKDKVIAKKLADQQDVENDYIQLSQDLAFFEKKLCELNNILASSTTAPENARQTLEEHNTMQSFVGALKNYFSEIETKTTLGIKRNKLSDQDVLILKAQAVGIKSMRNQLEQSNTASPDKLSQLIRDASKMEYAVSYRKVWLRRGVALLGGLVTAALAIGVTCALMTPGVNVIAAIIAVPMMLSAAVAFFGLRNPVMTHTQLSMGGFPMNISAIVPSTLGVAAAGIMGISLFRKLCITNPKKELAARTVTVGVINQLTDQLKKKIKTSTFDEKIKDSLLSTVNTADKMYNAGMQSWFYESRVSKMQKARLMLEETAEFLEKNVALTSSVDATTFIKPSSNEQNFKQAGLSKNNIAI